MAIQLKRDTKTLQIFYTSPSPDEPIYVTNIIIDIYKNIELSWKNSNIEELSLFLDKQLEDVSDQLSTIENKIKDFKEKENLIIFNSAENPKLLQYYNYEDKSQLLSAEISVLNKQIKYYEESLYKVQSDLEENLSNTNNLNIKQLQYDIIQKQLLIGKAKIDSTTSLITVTIKQ